MRPLKGKEPILHAKETRLEGEAKLRGGREEIRKLRGETSQGRYRRRSRAVDVIDVGVLGQSLSVQWCRLVVVRCCWVGQAENIPSPFYKRLLETERGW